ncbi:hypothetical protein [Paenibacillus sp. YN15]|uniref:hypothetical protein n=1 Tax=Paenibacillus sp. YN15 TaxID=1742774 RepID=UPI0011BFB6FA|nr:hypothetical protein [Paenibacillus sp. YN15]
MKKMLHIHTILAFALLLMLSPTSAFAYGNSIFLGGTSSNYSTSPIQYVQGARATITTPSTFPYAISGQMSTVWVAVVNSSNGALAQMGFASEPSVTSVNPHYFFVVVNPANPPGSQYSEITGLTGPSTSSTQTFSVVKESGTWKGYRSGSTVFFAGTSVTISPNSTQYYNETYDDSPVWFGTSSSKLKFANVQYWDGSASASDTSKWIWKKPNIPSSNFINEGTGTSIDTSSWSSDSTWYSWRY